VCFCENIKSHFTWFNLLITSYDLIVVTEFIQVTMENIILAKGDYVDLLINDQVIGLGRVESACSLGLIMVEKGSMRVMLWF
jgi:uncharacterized protein YlaN (UPF0358 family)